MTNIVIAGNLGKDAETRRTQNGDPVTGFNVAVEGYDGKEKYTLWFDVSFWGRRGESLAQYLTKGTRVTVAGDLGTREYNGKTYLTVRANEVTLQGGRQSHDTQRNDHQSGYDQSPPGYGAGGRPSVADDLSDEIPFHHCWQV